MLSLSASALLCCHLLYLHFFFLPLCTLPMLQSFPFCSDCYFLQLVSLLFLLFLLLPLSSSSFTSSSSSSSANPPFLPPPPPLSFSLAQMEPLHSEYQYGSVSELYSSSHQLVTLKLLLLFRMMQGKYAHI